MKLKRIAGLVLCLCMVITLLPMTAFAADGAKTYTFNSSQITSQPTSDLRANVYFKGDTIVFTPDVIESFTSSDHGVCKAPNVGLKIGCGADVTGGICSVNTYSSDGSGYMVSFTITSDNPVTLDYKGAGPTGIKTTPDADNNYYAYRYLELQFVAHPTSYPINYDLGTYGSWPSGTNPPTSLELDGNKDSYTLQIPTPQSNDSSYYFTNWQISENVKILSNPNISTGSTATVFPINGVVKLPFTICKAEVPYATIEEHFTITAVWSNAPRTAAPKFSVAGGTYSSTQNVALSCTTSNATIRYTTDGSVPTRFSTQYTVPIEVSSTTTIIARAFSPDDVYGIEDSEAVSATYTINTQPPALSTVATPTFSPAGGTFTSAQSVTLSCSTTGATIRYTTNGNDPTEASTAFVADTPIAVSSTTTIKAKAFKDGLTASEIASATYTITITPPAPAALSFTDSQNYDVPAGSTGVAITPVDVSSGVSGGSLPYTFTFEGMPPAWLDISNAGIITGTRPATAQTATTVAIKVTDSATPTVTASITISVGAVTETVQTSHPPSPPAPPSPVISDPVVDDCTATVTTKVTPTLSGTTASAAIPASTAKNAVSSALKSAAESGTAPVVEIALDIIARADGMKVTLPTAAIETLSENENAVLAITSDVGDITLDSAALAAVAEQASASVSVSIKPVDVSKLNERQKEAVGDAPVYDISITSGNVAISDLDGGQATVSVPYELADGQDADGIVVYYLDDEGNIHKCETTYDLATKTVSFVTTHFSKYVVGYDAIAAWVNPFSDVTKSDWFFEDAAYANLAGLMKGTSDTTFAPHGATTRGMIVEILYRLENKPAITGTCPFDDVASGKYYENAVTWAAANKIVDGYGDAKFGPEDPITREQIAAILYRYEQYNGGGFTGAWVFPLNFPDADKVSDWAYEAMCWCTMNGIINGNSDGTLAPQGNAERCQVAAILHRFCENVK